jgi:MscS family membrane protein
MEILSRTDLFFRQIAAGNTLFQFAASAAVLILGFMVLEFLFRVFRRRLLQTLNRKGVAPEKWNVRAVLPPLRLVFTAALLHLAQSLLTLPLELVGLLNGIEALLVAISVILILFHAIALIDRIPSVLPKRIQEDVPAPTVSQLNSALRIAVVISAAAVFVYTQKQLFPEWLWRFSWWRYLLLFVIFYMVVLLIRLSERFLSGMLQDLGRSAEKVRIRLVLHSTVWPVRLMLVNIAVYAFKEVIPVPASIGGIAEGAIGLLTTAAVVIFVYHLVDLIAHELSKIAQRPDNLMDQSFVQMVRIFARLMVIIVGSIYAIRALTGKPMSTLLAGLGIGGLAVALAAQDTLKNLFGSIMIMLDKPFDVGERVVVDGLDGTIEEIGFRSTRMRTMTGHQVTVPNEKMAGSNIENVGRRPSIRRLTNITITYDTPPEKVERAVEIIRRILENHEGMHPDYPPRVHFNEFNDTSLNIIMLYWYHPPDYWSYIAFSERVNLRIMRAFEAEGIEFAFPTTTTYLAHDPKRPLQIFHSGEPAARKAEPIQPELLPPLDPKPKMVSES